MNMFHITVFNFVNIQNINNQEQKNGNSLEIFYVTFLWYPQYTTQMNMINELKNYYKVTIKDVWNSENVNWFKNENIQAIPVILVRIYVQQESEIKATINKFFHHNATIEDIINYIEYGK